MTLLIVTAVEAEARAIGAIEGATVIVAGIGRTNAAAAATEAILAGRGRIRAVMNAGVAGTLPAVSGALPLPIGAAILASSCIYVEEGLISPTGFVGMEGMGFPLGDFAGNAVPVDVSLFETLSEHFQFGPIATVATCSGTDEAALEVVRRTGALAEAMEGAAVVHAARRLKVPAIELRVISNTTGDRTRQRWELPRALIALGQAVRCAMTAIAQK